MMILFAYLALLLSLLFSIVAGRGTPSPTQSFSPTVSPRPTLQPSSVPTPLPSVSIKPTFEPTAKPTFAPSADPSASPTLDPTARPTAEPSVSFNPTPVPTPAPTHSSTEPFFMANQTIYKIYNLNATSWTTKSFDVILSTVAQVLYNYQLSITDIVISPNVVSIPELQGSGSYSAAMVSYSVYYVAAALGQTTASLYASMSATLEQSVSSGSFDTILQYESGKLGDPHFLEAYSTNVTSILDNPVVPSDSSSSSSDDTKLHTDELVGIIFASIFVVFVSLWKFSSYLSERKLNQDEEAAANPIRSSVAVQNAMFRPSASSTK